MSCPYCLISCITHTPLVGKNDGGQKPAAAKPHSAANAPRRDPQRQAARRRRQHDAPEKPTARRGKNDPQPPAPRKPTQAETRQRHRREQAAAGRREPQTRRGEPTPKRQRPTPRRPKTPQETSGGRPRRAPTLNDRRHGATAGTDQKTEPHNDGTGTPNTQNTQSKHPQRKARPPARRNTQPRTKAAKRQPNNRRGARQRPNRQPRRRNHKAPDNGRNAGHEGDGEHDAAGRAEGTGQKTEKPETRTRHNTGHTPKTGQERTRAPKRRTDSACAAPAQRKGSRAPRSVFLSGWRG